MPQVMPFAATVTFSCSASGTNSEMLQPSAPLPLADGRVGHIQRRGKLLLGHPLFPAQLCPENGQMQPCPVEHIFASWRTFSAHFWLVYHRRLSQPTRSRISAPPSLLKKKRRTIPRSASPFYRLPERPSNPIKEPSGPDRRPARSGTPPPEEE